MNVLYREWVGTSNFHLITATAQCSLTSNMTYYHGTLMFRKGSVAYTIQWNFTSINNHDVKALCVDLLLTEITIETIPPILHSIFILCIFTNKKQCTMGLQPSDTLVWTSLMTQVCVKCLYSLMKVCLLTGCYSITPTRRCDFTLLCNKYLYAQVA